jgi:integrase
VPYQGCKYGTDARTAGRLPAAGPFIADRVPDRFRALVLLGTFASLCWGELVALRRRHVDVERGLVRVVAAYNELSTGKMLLGPPKSAASRQLSPYPRLILPDIARHLAKHAAPGSDGLMFVGVKGDPVRRSRFNKPARQRPTAHDDEGPDLGDMPLTWPFRLERVTGIEPALSAWEVDRSRAHGTADQAKLAREQ